MKCDGIEDASTLLPSLGESNFKCTHSEILGSLRVFQGFLSSMYVDEGVY